jgi:hypothetical protein
VQAKLDKLTDYGVKRPTGEEMSLIIPKHLLAWIDESRGAMSRQAFIIQCLFKLREVIELKQN